MNLLKIRYFVEVARCGSFSGAAAKLYTSQPNISKQIAQMEQELDFPLFTRDKRTIRLTAAGQFLYDNLRDVPDRLEDLFEQAAALAGKENSHISIGILEGQEVRPQLLYRLELAKEMFPQMEMELERNSFANLRGVEAPPPTMEDERVRKDGSRVYFKRFALIIVYSGGRQKARLFFEVNC